MSRRLVLAAAAAALVLPCGVSAPAAAQSDPAALQLIERLRPQGGSQTRGIRVPGAADAAPAAPAPVQPAPIYGGQAPAAPAPSVAGPATPAPKPVAAAPARASARETTAPIGTPSASITVNFPSGSATLTPQAERALAPLGQALSSADLAPYRFRIEGHTDTTGDADMNQTLSERRAAAVRDHLTQRYGVSPARLEAVGLGESQLLVPTPDNRSEARNRRVQVLNIGG